MLTDEKQISAAPLVVPDVVNPATVTSGERARAALAGVLIKFAEENLPEITDADLSPATDLVDFENPKASLLNHPGVKKTICVVASVAAQSQQWELRKFDYLWPQKYLDEIHAEIRQCTDSRTVNLLFAKAEAFLQFQESCPATVLEFRDYARTHRSNTEYAIATLIKVSRKIAGEWFQVIPADSVRELRDALGRLATAPLRAQMAYFGLLDLMPTGELPPLPPLPPLPREAA